MGLDMYLTAERFFWFNETPPEIEAVPEPFKVQSVLVHAAYWRKANAVHDWFVNTVQDGVDECQESPVSRETLQQLIDLCKEVIEKPELAPELLPTAAGFFFGSTDYDEWYFSDLQFTVDQLELALNTLPEKDWDFTYRASW